MDIGTIAVLDALGILNLLRARNPFLNQGALVDLLFQKLEEEGKTLQELSTDKQELLKLLSLISEKEDHILSAKKGLRIARLADLSSECGALLAGEQLDLIVHHLEEQSITYLDMGISQENFSVLWRNTTKIRVPYWLRELRADLRMLGTVGPKIPIIDKIKTSLQRAGFNPEDFGTSFQELNSFK